MVDLSGRSLKHILAGGFAVAMLASTGPARAASAAIVYSFRGGNDGAHPNGGLIDVGGTLYGTTYGGGRSQCHHRPPRACGTVFSVTPAGAETVVYSFQGANDGGKPVGDLINVEGVLYGSTSFYRDQFHWFGGTVFSVTPAGAQTVVYSFRARFGYSSVSGLINVNGTLYGTNSAGGEHRFGTVFSFTPTGTEATVYAFKGGSDGATPSAALTNVGSTLYGTTASGGGGAGCGNSGCGTVFSVTPAGAETVVYSFQGGSDGATPSAALTNVGGTLYGTTASGGGGAGCGSSGCGTVFSVTAAGAETVVYSFQGGSDGAAPEAALINVNGTLYGTTFAGGGSRKCGCGTVFSITPSGVETVVYAFQGGGHGARPFGSLVNVNGTLYGTTDGGGTAGNHGTVFAITP